MVLVCGYLVFKCIASLLEKAQLVRWQDGVLLWKCVLWYIHWLHSIGMLRAQ